MSLTFDRFSIENFIDLSKNVLTLSVFELEKCFYFLNRSEFHQKLIGNIIRGLVRNQRSYSEIGNQERPLRAKCHIRAQCPPPPSQKLSLLLWPLYSKFWFLDFLLVFCIEPVSPICIFGVQWSQYLKKKLFSKIFCVENHPVTLIICKGILD